MASAWLVCRWESRRSRPAWNAAIQSLPGQRRWPGRVPSWRSFCGNHVGEAKPELDGTPAADGLSAALPGRGGERASGRLVPGLGSDPWIREVWPTCSAWTPGSAQGLPGARGPCPPRGVRVAEKGGGLLGDRRDLLRVPPAAPARLGAEAGEARAAPG